MKNKKIFSFSLITLLPSTLVPLVSCNQKKEKEIKYDINYCGTAHWNENDEGFQLDNPYEIKTQQMEESESPYNDEDAAKKYVEDVKNNRQILFDDYLNYEFNDHVLLQPNVITSESKYTRDVSLKLNNIERSDSNIIYISMDVLFEQSLQLFDSNDEEYKKDSKSTYKFEFHNVPFEFLYLNNGMEEGWFTRPLSPVFTDEDSYIEISWSHSFTCFQSGELKDSGERTSSQKCDKNFPNQIIGDYEVETQMQKISYMDFISFKSNYFDLQQAESNM